MRVRAFILALVITVLQAAVSTVPAQTESAQAALYELGKNSLYEQGCFAPCMCPIMMADGIRGTFILRRLASDWLFDYYAVTDVKWIVRSGSSVQVLTGSGTYRIGGEFALTHQLTLDLRTNEGPVEHFDSGLVPGGGNFPAIDVGISIHGFTCYDTGIQVRAWPAMRVDVDHLRISWDQARQATRYDVVMGDLGALRAGGGDFAVATQRCLGTDVPATWLPLGDDPAPGQGFWFLVRSVDGLTGDSYDEGEASQVGSRDAGIARSHSSCP